MVLSHSYLLHPPLLYGFRFDRVIRLLSTAPEMVLVVDLGVFALVFSTEGNVLDGLLSEGEEGAMEGPTNGEQGAGEDELRNGVFLTCSLFYPLRH